MAWSRPAVALTTLPLILNVAAFGSPLRGPIGSATANSGSHTVHTAITLEEEGGKLDLDTGVDSARTTGADGRHGEENVEAKTEGVLVEKGPPADPLAETPEAADVKKPSQDDESTPCKPSKAVNLGATKALKRPATNNPLDSHTYIAGIRCREKGFLKQDFMLQSIPEIEKIWDQGFELIGVYYPDVTFSDFGEPFFTSFYIISADLYTGRTGGLWDGGQFHFTTAGFTDQERLSRIAVNHLPRFETATNDSWRIFELWYGQKFGDIFEIRFGKIYPFVRQASHQTSAIFQNYIFDYPGLFGTTEFTGNFLAYPQAPLGMQAFWTPNKHHQISLYVGDGKDDPTGGQEFLLSDIQLNSEDGAEFILEYAYLNHSPDPTHMPGYYKIGFQANTGRFFNYNKGEIDSGGIYGGYITLEQMLVAEPPQPNKPARSQGLMVFGKAMISPSPRNIVTFAGSAGLAYAGLVPGRDSDMAAIGVGHARYNQDAADFNVQQAALQGLVRRSAASETVLEAVYHAQLTPWLMIIGSYQYIFDPSPLGALNPENTTGQVFMLNTRVAF